MSKLTAISKFSSTITLAILGAAIAATLPASAHAQGVKDLQAAAFKIMTADGSQVLGRGEYHLESGAQPVLIGQNKYSDGEYDIERDVIVPSSDGGISAMLSFEHTYFNADGSKKFMARADLRSGEAGCISYDTGDESGATKRIEFPTDTWAGATAVLAMENALRIGGGQASFHVFDCGPNPNVVKVSATQIGDGESVASYPRPLTTIDVTADLGWVGGLVGGLLPHRHAWFDSASGWRFVAGKIQRYFASGPQVMMVRDAAAYSQRASN
jgi:hypothetical protein